MSDNKSQDDDEWWSRVILIIDQPVEDMMDMASKRKNILYQVIPEIQKKYHLSKPLSLLFLNSNNDDGKCREILWQMLEKHNQHGRYTGEIQLNDDIDSTSSDEDDSPFQTVIEYIDGVRKKEPKRKNVLLKRQVQKLHSYDDTAAP
jgi:hypothetical protein